MIYKKIFYKLTEFFLNFVLRVFFRLQIEGSDFILSKGPIIIAVNHLSNLDPLVVGISTKRYLNFFAKKELFKNKFLAKIIFILGGLSLNRNGVSLGIFKKSIEILNKDGAIVLFPQGKRTANLSNNVYSGVGFLVEKTKAPVIPARIYGTDKVLPKGKIFPRLAKIKIVFGRPMFFDNYSDYNMITREIMAQIIKL